MHARRRGKSGSVRPHRDDPPAWSTTDAAEIEQLVIDLHRKEKSSAEIGTILRDQYAVPDVKLATGRRVGEILEANGLGTEIPEDLRNLIVKALGMRKHLAENRNDVHNKRQLQLTESKVRRLVKYYVGSKRLPTGWVYKPDTAEILLSR
jgi:small subunit ribosomal protein S15